MIFLQQNIYWSVKNMPIIPILTEEPGSNTLTAKLSFKHSIWDAHYDNDEKYNKYPSIFNGNYDEAPATNKPIVKFEDNYLDDRRGNHLIGYHNTKWCYFDENSYVDSYGIDGENNHGPIMPISLCFDLKFDNIKTPHEIDAETDQIHTISDAITYMNNFWAKYYSIDLLMNDMANAGFEKTNPDGSKIRQTFTDISANADKSLNFTLTYEKTTNKHTETTHIEIKNMPIIPVLVRDSKNSLKVKWALKYRLSDISWKKDKPGTQPSDTINSYFDKAPDTDKPVGLLETTSHFFVKDNQPISDDYSNYKWRYFYQDNPVNQTEVIEANNNQIFTFDPSIDLVFKNINSSNTNQ